MKLNCIIVDDEPIARKLLQEYIEDIDFLHLAGVAENPLKANGLLLEGTTDLMFLDINMPKMSGIDFLRTGVSLPPVILTTAYADYALEGYALNVLDYLVKPFAADRFLKACLKAREYIAARQPTTAPATGYADGHFFVKCDGRYEKVQYGELVYVEAMMNYVVLHTETRKLVVYLTIKGILEQLPADIFVKIHKSTIINTKKIKSIEGNMVNLGKVQVAISQNLYDTVINGILQDKVLKR